MPEPLSTTLEVRVPESLNRPRTISPPTAFVRVQQRPDGTLVFVAPRPDPLGAIGRRFGKVKMALAAAFAPAFRQMVEYAQAMQRTMAQVNALLAVPQHVRDEANSLHRVAGLEARYYVRAALDPAYASPYHLSGLVQSVLSGDEPDLAHVTRENRIQIAVAAMRGWEERGTGWTVYGRTEPPLIAHRQWGSACVEVSCG